MDMNELTMYFQSLSGGQGVEEQWSHSWVAGRTMCSFKVPGSLEGSQMVLRVQTGAFAPMPELLSQDWYSHNTSLTAG